MNADRTKWLLMAVLLLAVVKFVVMPWREQQAESAQSLQVLTQRLDRSAGVVLNKEKILITRDQLRRANAPVAALFPLSSGDAEAQLSVQSSMDAVLQRHGLKLGLFDWVATNVEAGGSLRYSRFQLQTSGETSVLARFLADVESGSQQIVIREVSLQGQPLLRGASAGDQSELRLVADVYFRIKGSS
jgi:hypothetical protein